MDRVYPGKEIASPSERAGVQTLSADDIINYYFAAENRPFDFVLLAEEDTEKENCILLRVVSYWFLLHNLDQLCYIFVHIIRITIYVV